LPEAWIKIGNTAKADEFLEQTKKKVYSFNLETREYFLPRLARIFAEMGKDSKAHILNEEFYEALSKLQPEGQAVALSTYADACITIFDTDELLKRLDEARIIQDSLTSIHADQMSPNARATALRVLIRIYVRSARIKKDKRFLEQARFLLDRSNVEDRSLTLLEIANVYLIMQERNDSA
jgi:hypothetical protein